MGRQMAQEMETVAPTERRTCPEAEVRLVVGASGGTPRLTGYAVVYGSLSRNLGGFRERIAPGAFGESLAAGRDILAFVNHDDGAVLGRTSAGTLRVWEDAGGVRFDVALPDTQPARDLAESVRRGDVRGASFGFRVEEDSWGYEGKHRVRTVRRATLYEVSPTAIPAYEDTTVALRAMPRDTESATPLRDALQAALQNLQGV